MTLSTRAEFLTKTILFFSFKNGRAFFILSTFLSRAIETLKYFETSYFELGVHEGRWIFVLLYRLGEKFLDSLVDSLEHLQEVRGEFVDDLRAECGAGAGHGGAGPVLDQLADVGTNEALLRRVEIAIDVPECRQVEDDGVHFLLGLVGILAKRQHGGVHHTQLF